MLLRLFLIIRYSKGYHIIILLTLITHTRGVHGLLLFLLEVADAIDGGKGCIRSVRIPNAHRVILIGKCRTDVGITIENIRAFGYEAPLAVVGCPTERSMKTEHRVDVINSLNGF